MVEPARTPTDRLHSADLWTRTCLAGLVAAALSLGPASVGAAGPTAPAGNAATAARSTTVAAPTDKGGRKDANARVYVVRPGDTLISIGDELLEVPADWAELKRLNRVADARRLRPGQRLFIPAYLLKSEPDVAVIVSADAASRLNGQPIKAGAQVGESSVIETGEHSVVTLRLSDGSTLRLEPASRLRLERLRRYHGERAIEARVLLEQGRIETSAATERRKPMTVRTPIATAAVRGTAFRVSAEPALATTEVLDGSVWWGQPPPAARSARTDARRATTTGRHRVQVDKDFGSRADAGGPQKVEALLAAPDLSGLPPRIELPLESVNFPPVQGAVAYRIDVSRDAEATDLVSTVVTPRPTVSVASRSDGQHFVHVRPIAASRVEGLEARSEITVAARPFPPAGIEPPDQAVVFGAQVPVKWSRPEGTNAFQIELAETADFSHPLSSERVTGNATTLDIKAGGSRPVERYWRIASIDSAGQRGPFAVNRLQWRPDAPPPGVAEARLGVMKLRWPAQDGERYVIELANEPGFLSPQRFEVTTGELELRDLPPGHYHLRMKSVAPDGLSSPFSPSQSFDVKPVVSSAGGSPLQSGTGLTIESPLDF